MRHVNWAFRRQYRRIICNDIAVEYRCEEAGHRRSQGYDKRAMIALGRTGTAAGRVLSLCCRRDGDRRVEARFNGEEDNWLESVEGKEILQSQRRRMIAIKLTACLAV